MTNSFNEFSDARMMVAIGTNMTEAHPVASTFVKNAVAKGVKLIVIDRRKHKPCDFAAPHLPLKVGSDIALPNALMYVLIEEGLYDSKCVESCTVGFDAMKQKIMEYPPERAAKISGIDAKVMRDTARLMASVKPAMLCYTPGITEDTCGVNNVLTMANLRMLPGSMGKEGGGVNPLRGQNNVQDADRMGIESSEKIRVKSRRGEVVVKAGVTPEVPAAMVWMTFHFRENCANWLTKAVFDPVSQTAEYKACAVQIEKL
jgi:formate dehydrogenase major subunit